LSGFEQAGQQQKLQAYLLGSGSLSSHFFVVNDSVGSAFTGCANGGMVIISGTGSIAQYISHDGRSSRTGGWGHLLGDEGGAYHIASTALKAVFHVLDGFTRYPCEKQPDLAVVMSAMLSYFEIAHPDDVLTYMYQDFNKAKVAGFTKVLASLAHDGDAYCIELFQEAGVLLGAMARTLAPFIEATSADKSIQSVTIVCEGSVWKSWDILKCGFCSAAFCPAVTATKSYYQQSKGLISHGRQVKRECALPGEDQAVQLGPLRLVRLKDTCAIGTAVMAAAKVGCSIQLDRSKIIEELDFVQPPLAVEQ
jgi:N-acetylglucosamine kinase